MQLNYRKTLTDAEAFASLCYHKVGFGRGDSESVYFLPADRPSSECEWCQQIAIDVSSLFASLRELPSQESLRRVRSFVQLMLKCTEDELDLLAWLLERGGAEGQ